MALFQKKPTVESGQQLYSLAANRTFLIVGLGNPAKRYDNTRHNIGFAVLDSFAVSNDFPNWVEKKDFKALLSIQTLGDKRVVLVKPTTFMNRSGEAMQSVQHYYKIANSDALVVYDELAIAFGQIRTRMGGSDGGHNGVKSIIANCGEDFGRLRIGIGSELSSEFENANFVLSKFSCAEQASLPNIIREAEVLIAEFIFSDKLNPDTRTIL